MTDFVTQIAQQPKISERKQVELGKAAGNDMGSVHKDFLAQIIAMLDRKEIDVGKPESFLNIGIYDRLPQAIRGKVDFAMVNIADQLRRIEEFYRSKKTPNASPELQTMIEHLWQMKDRIETQYGDVFKF